MNRTGIHKFNHKIEIRRNQLLLWCSGSGIPYFLRINNAINSEFCCIFQNLREI